MGEASINAIRGSLTHVRRRLSDAATEIDQLDQQRAVLVTQMQELDEAERELAQTLEEMTNARA